MLTCMGDFCFENKNLPFPALFSLVPAIANNKKYLLVFLQKNNKLQEFCQLKL